MEDFINRLKQAFRTGNIVVKLIFINVTVFFLMLVINFVFLQKAPHLIQDYFAVLPGIQGLLKQPWGIFTYSFFHSPQDLFRHLLLNMLLLYFVGNLFLRHFRGNNLLTFYVFGAAAGGILFALLSGTLNYGKPIIGASAGIYAVFFALVSYMPKMKVQFIFSNSGIPLVYFAYFFIALDVFAILSMSSNIGGNVSHLGGAAFGYLYMKQFEKGNDFLGNITNKLLSFNFKKRETQNKSNQTYQKTNHDFDKSKSRNEKEINEILEKISRSGYDSLTKEEKEFLFKSKK